MILSLIVPVLAVGVTYCYASVLDLRERRVPFRTWYPMLAAGLPFTVLFYLLLIDEGDLRATLFFLILTLFFSFLFYLFARFRLFGGADAWALIFLAALIPAFPVVPLVGVPPLGYFPFSVLVNAVMLNLVTPIGICIYNLKEGNTAPFPYLFLGFPVDGDRISESYGFVMEDITEDEGGIHRRFLGIGESLMDMTGGGSRVYTLAMRREPEAFAQERDLYRKAGKVWISYGVPFIVPITAGFFTALIFGDIIFYLLTLLMGG